MRYEEGYVLMNPAARRSVSRRIACLAFVCGTGMAMLSSGCGSPVSVDRTSELRFSTHDELERYRGLVLTIDGPERSHTLTIDDFTVDSTAPAERFITPEVPLAKRDSVSIGVRLMAADGSVQRRATFALAGAEKWILALMYRYGEDPLFECRSCRAQVRLSIPPDLQEDHALLGEEYLWLIWIRAEP